MGFPFAPKIAGSPVIVASVAAASADESLPEDGSGVTAKFVMVKADGDGYYDIGVGATTASPTDPFIAATDDPFILDVSGFNMIAFEAVSGSANLYVTPLATQ